MMSIKTEFYGIFLALLVSFVSIGLSSQCIVTVTIEGGPVIRVNENEGLLSVTLKRTGNTTIEAKVNVSTDENTAKAGADKDFISIPPYHTVTLAPNSDTAAFNITIVDDHWVEAEMIKNFFVNMTTKDANVCAPLPTATIEIKDDDKVTVGFHDDVRTFSENHGNFSLKFFKRQNQTKIPITVSFSTPGIGSAVVNVDYKNMSGSMTFAESQFTKDFPDEGMIIDNNIVEATKCFNITLTANDPRIMFDPQQSKICITNDDKATIEFATRSVNTTVAEQKKNVSLDINKTGKTTIPIKVRLNMLQRFFETAKAGEDFTTRHNDIITFGENETKKTVWFTIDDDSKAESSEVFAVALEAVDSSTTTIGANNLAVISIDDESDREFQATTQKQKQEEQERRVQLLTILLCVAVALIFVIVAGLIICVCLLKKRLKQYDT